MTLAVSSFVICTPIEVMTGASFTEVMDTCRVTATLEVSPSFTENSMVRVSVSGLSLEFWYPTDERMTMYSANVDVPCIVNTPESSSKLTCASPEFEIISVSSMDLYPPTNDIHAESIFTSSKSVILISETIITGSAFSI